MTIVAAQIYMSSAHGLRMRAAREDEVAARAAGIVVWRERLIAFVISAFFFAIGGILFGHFLGTLAVSIFWLNMTFLTLAMLVVGGLRSLTGAVVGTLAVAAIRASSAPSSRDSISAARPCKSRKGCRKSRLPSSFC